MRNSILGRIYQRIPVLRELFSINDSLHVIKQSVQSLQRQLDNRQSLEVIRLLDFELANHPRYSDPKRLLRYAFQACSQNGEDGMIHEIFRRIGTSNKFFVEIGVGDGNENNTAFLISKGWQGLWIDGNPEFINTIRTRGWIVSGQVRGISALVSKNNVTELLNSASVPRDLDLLSVDVDQNTYHVWSGVAGFSPRVVVVEFNAAFPPDTEWIVPHNPAASWNGSQNFGASLKSFQRLGDRLGYHLVGCDFLGINAFFVRNDLTKDLFSEPYSAENHYEPLRYAASTRRGHSKEAFDVHNSID